LIQLILVRHGNTFETGETPVQIGARTDLHLSVRGKAQAEEVARYLISRGISPKALYSGVLKRQRESAEIAASYFNLKVIETSALTEIDYGLWEGLSSEEISAKWPKEYKEWAEEGKWQSHIFQGSEESHRQKFDAWFDHLKNSHRDNTVVAFTSNGLLRFLRKEKVKTGHICELLLYPSEVQICSWNRNPSDQ
jgi:2,3-bisphosphoglycerate-dependent phosphoglycerate mutase